ncbi:MAG: putative hydrolase [Acidobacteriaceae bacterium]|nr:putative hydrolase [Acidobacteriaceae bacterium]
MRPFRLWTAIVTGLFFFATVAYAQVDSTAHKVQFVRVARDIKLEVLDWGGSGRPLVLLPGLGDTAHVFDKFALELTDAYHVFGITPRGYGASSKPPAVVANYAADRLGNDVMQVISSLNLERPILASHSVAGEVLSSVGTRYPGKVSALIYIDAGYSYALYDQTHGDLVLDAIALRNELNGLHLGTLPRNPTLVNELLIEVQQLEKELQQRKDDFSQISAPNPIDNPISVALLDGQQKFTQIGLPVLAIFNVPHSPVFRRTMEDQVNAFETKIPRAHIIRIENADHYLFQSKDIDVVGAINAFVASLPNKD